MVDGPAVPVPRRDFFERPRWREFVRHWKWLLLLSLFGPAGYNFLLLHAALQLTDALDASLINAFNPALIALGSMAFLKERLSWKGTSGLGLALTGGGHDDRGRLFQLALG